MNPQPDATEKLHPTVLDTSVTQVARVYALALHDAADGRGQLDELVDEYESFLADVIAKHPTFEQTLQSTIIPRADKAATLRKIFQGKASDIFLNYLLVLNDHDRLSLLRPVLAEVKSIRDQRHGRVPVQIRTAVPLDPAQEKALRERLAAVVAGLPVIHVDVDPALLGGLVIRVSDTVFDGSVRTRLRRAREQLLQRSTHEIQSRRDQFRTAT